MSTDAKTPDEIREEIERTRDDLADTVDALHAKIDVKSRAQDKAAELKDRATTDAGKPRPAVLGGLVAVLVTGAALVWWRRR
ncbi:MAG: DUF3618 domain-containing protein [Nocardioides sp.]